jgi:ribosomal protein S18 acetylase RimI-like enzyme
MTFSSHPLPPTDPQTNRASTFRIQPAKTEELALVADVMSQVFNPPVGVQGFFFPLYRLTVSADLHKRMRSDPRHYCCLGAWWGATMVGALEISLRDLSGVPQPGLHPYVSNLAVLPQWRRRGVAQQLLTGAEAVALAWGYQALHLHVLESNPAARHLYEKMEYRVLHVSSDLWQWLGASRQFLLYRRLGFDPVSRVDPAR